MMLSWMSLLPASRRDSIEGYEKSAIFESLLKVLEGTSESFEFKHSLECVLASQTEHDRRLRGEGGRGKLDRQGGDTLKTRVSVTSVRRDIRNQEEPWGGE